jgi:hypothetical protein
MVTTEYPPMQGGVGRYAARLTKSLQKLGLEVYVVCNEKGKGDYYGLSSYNDDNNSCVLLKVVHDLIPDIRRYSSITARFVASVIGGCIKRI